MTTQTSPTGRTTVALLLALTATGAPNFTQEPDAGDERRTETVARALLDARQGLGSRDQLVTRLAAPGADALPPLFDTLVAGRIELRVQENGTVEHVLTPAEDHALLAAMGLPGAPALRRFLDERRMLQEPSTAERLIAVRALGAHGADADLRRLAEWCSPSGENPRVPRAWRDAFGSALGLLLDRHPAAIEDTPELFRQAPVALLPTLLTALGERPSDASLGALSRVLGRVPEADAFVLVELGHVARRARRPADDATRMAVRQYLRRTGGPLLIETIATVGRLEDQEAVADLVDLLGHSEVQVREQAMKALEKITGERLGDDRQDWADWHEGTRLWWRRHGERLQRAVESGAPAACSRALLELSQKRFFRHRLALPVSRGLDRPEEELVTLTCAALGHLGSRIAVPELLACLEDERVSVKKAAHLALRRITAEDHGELREDWVAAGW